MACVVVPDQGVFASGVIRFLDCEAQTLGEQGYQALAASNSIVGVALTAMLTIFVALYGYRMLLGDVPTLRDGVLAFVKIGVVLALATGWPAFRTLVYDVALRAPAELAAATGTPAGIPGADGGLLVRLDLADQQFDALAIAGVTSRQTRRSSDDDDDQPAQVGPAAPPLFAGFDTFAIGAARAIFLAGAIGSFGFARLGAGLLLALGPLFIAFLLFEGTRGLFEGWLRALTGTALAAFAAALVLGIELAFLEPWLAILVSARQGGDPITGVPVELLAATTIFALLLAAAMALMVRVAMGFRLPAAWRGGATAAIGRSDRISGDRIAGSAAPARWAAGEERSRALQVADAVAARQRREGASPATGPSATGGASARAPGAAAQARDGATGVATPLGQGARRRAGNRVSASAGRRDQGA